MHHVVVVCSFSLPREVSVQPLDQDNNIICMPRLAEDGSEVDVPGLTPRKCVPQILNHLIPSTPAHDLMALPLMAHGSTFDHAICFSVRAAT